VGSRKGFPETRGWATAFALNYSLALYFGYINWRAMFGLLLKALRE
jgi:hypothetical protein